MKNPDDQSLPPERPPSTLLELVDSDDWLLAKPEDQLAMIEALADRMRKPMGRKKREFVKPTIEEIAAYCAEKGYRINAAKFWHYYESNGWYVGKKPMKSWHSALFGWLEREKPMPPPRPAAVPQPDDEKFY